MSQTPKRSNKPGGDHHHDDADCARGPIQGQAACDVVWSTLGPAIAHSAILDPRRAIDPRPGQAQAERAGHGGLGPPGIG